MRAVVIRELGGPEALVVVEAVVPEPGPGEALIRVETAAVNPTDVMVRVGALVQHGAAVRPSSTGSASTSPARSTRSGRR